MIQPSTFQINTKSFHLNLIPMNPFALQVTYTQRVSRRWQWWQIKEQGKQQRVSMLQEISCVLWLFICVLWVLIFLTSSCFFKPFFC